MLISSKEQQEEQQKIVQNATPTFQMATVGKKKFQA
jgi:hypothetical protein